MSGTHVRVGIIGSGFGGIGMAIRLMQKGERDFLIFERAAEIGGVWRDNSYPGCACDVESHLYSFSFARNPNWSRTYSPQGEILQYLRACADEHGVTPHVKLDHAIVSAAWDNDARLWRLQTTHGEYTADILVSATGGLSDAKIPQLPGAETFKGERFHSSQWNHAFDLTGKRVAVIGTGASAIQFVPEIQPKVASLVVFQRTAPWVMPRNDRAHPERTKKLLRSSKLAQLAVRASVYARREVTALAFFEPRVSAFAQQQVEKDIAKQISDPVLRAKVTPTYQLGCKRVLVSDNYLPSLTQHNVTLETSGIAEITEAAVIAKDGTRFPVDAIIYGTGFQVQEIPIAKLVRGRDGKTMRETWGERMTAHLGTTVHNFPNLFFLLGPNTGLGHSSVILMIEAQIEHVLNALAYMDKHGIAIVEPRAEVQHAFIEEIDGKTKRTVWATGGCDSWYLDGQGNNTTLWPGFTFTYARRAAPFDPRHHLMTRKDDAVRVPRLAHRLLARAGRLLGGLPESAVRRLVGAPIVRDGQTLAPDLQLLLFGMGKAASLIADSPGKLRKNQRLAAVLGAGAPVEVRAVHDLHVDGLRARHYVPAMPNAPLVVFLHGGGFVFGDLHTHDRVCRMLCLHADVNVLAIEYRLAPEHPFPAGVDDAERAWTWAQAHAAELAADPARIAIAGDSAGGNLATIISQAHAGKPTAPYAQLLIYPVVDQLGAYPSKELFADGFFLTTEAIQWFFAHYAQTAGTDPKDPRLNPAFGTDLADQPPAIIITAGFDPLRDEGEAYGAALQRAGSIAIVRRFPHLVHGFANMSGVSKSSAAAVIEIAGMLRTLLALPAHNRSLAPALLATPSRTGTSRTKHVH